MDSELKAGDLTVTDDGYYGIVKDPKERTIMLGNGLTQIVDEPEWEELRPFPLREGAEAPANFLEFLLIFQQEFNYRRMLSWYIDHVGQMEGINFLSDRYKPKEISDEEWKELQRLAQSGAMNGV